MMINVFMQLFFLSARIYYVITFTNVISKI